MKEKRLWTVAAIAVIALSLGIGVFIGAFLQFAAFYSTIAELSSNIRVEQVNIDFNETAMVDKMYEYVKKDNEDYFSLVAIGRCYEKTGDYSASISVDYPEDFSRVQCSDGSYLS